MPGRYGKNTKCVAVIGAGMSGLVAIKQCLDERLEPVCYEQRTDLGGLWNYSETVVKGRCSVMKSTVANNCKESNCFSDFPVPAHFPVFLTHQKQLEYFRLYAQKFDLERHISFDCIVLEVVKAEDFMSTGKWIVTIRNCISGRSWSEVFDGVLVCHGRHFLPYTPRCEGQLKFKGRQLHSSEYRSEKSFKDKRVVIVGMGNSAVDIACELGKVAEQVFLSTRHGAWLRRRLTPDGKPVDLDTNRRLIHYIMRRLPCSLRNYILAQRLNLGGVDHEKFGLEPEHYCDSRINVTNDDLPTSLVTGQVKLKSGVRQLTETSVVFDDGTTEEDIDVIVYATGYGFDFPFLRNNRFIGEQEREGVGEEEERDGEGGGQRQGEAEGNDGRNRTLNLYKFVFSPEIEPPTLAVIGCMETSGASTSVSELQARWAVRVVKGVVSLPSRDTMLADIQSRRSRVSGVPLATMSHPTEPDWMDYLDDVADEIGCKPKIMSLLLTDPVLAVSLLFGPTTPFHYRLVGPGAWTPARQAILTVWDRVYTPLRTRKITIGLNNWRTVRIYLRVAAIFCIAIVIVMIALL